MDSSPAAGPLLDLPLAVLLLALAAIDLRRRIVPNRLLGPAVVWALTCTAAFEPARLAGRVAAGVLAFGALLLLALVSRGGIGMGDAKLAGVIGVFLGPSALPALFAAFLAGSLAGAVVLLREGAGARKKALPFVPFLALGGFIGLFFGDDLLALYLERLL